MMEEKAKNHIEYLEAQRDLFEADYIYMHPKPETDTKSQRYTLLFMLGATIIVSARHNIPFFLGEVMPDDELGKVLTVIFAIAIVVMVEVGLVKFGEFIIEYMDDDTVTMIRPWLLGFALFLLLVLAIFSNVIHQLDIKNLFVAEWLKTLINILAGLSAPVMALIIGIIFASLELKVEQAKSDWQTAFNRAYGKFKSSNEIEITVSKPATPTLPRMERTHGNINSTENSMGNGKIQAEIVDGKSNKLTILDEAINHYRMNPNDLKLDPIELGGQLGIGKSTMYKARSQVKKEMKK